MFKIKLELVFVLFYFLFTTKCVELIMREGEVTLLPRFLTSDFANISRRNIAVHTFMQSVSSCHQYYSQNVPKYSTVHAMSVIHHAHASSIHSFIQTTLIYSDIHRTQTPYKRCPTNYEWWFAKLKNSVSIQWRKWIYCKITEMRSWMDMIIKRVKRIN